MAGQTTLRLASNLSGTTGTQIRDVRPDEIHFIMRQKNVVGALFGNEKFRNAKGMEIPSRPRILKTKQIDHYMTEVFSNELQNQSFEVTSGATSSGTSITVTTNYAEIYADSLMQVAETGDVVFVSANSSGTLTIERYSGASAISIGDHLIMLGQVKGESSTNPNIYLRNDDNHYNYTVETHTAWIQSLRDSNIKRYGGKSFMNLQNSKLAEHVAVLEHMLICSKRSSGLTANSATTPRGFESHAQDGNGTTFDFGGTIETSECRELGDVAAEYSTGGRLICMTSQAVISAFMSSLDSKLVMSPSELKSKAGLPTAKAFDLGAATIEFVPCNTYKQSGKEGQGVIFDASLAEVRYLQDITLFKSGPIDDSTQTSKLYGEWYSDHCGLMFKDGGKNCVYFTGANALAS